MLDNIRRKFSYSNVKVFYNKTYDLGRFEDLIYYKSVGSALPRMRCTQKKSTKSFRYIYESSRAVKLRDVEIKMISCSAGKFEMGHIVEDANKPRPETIERPFLLGETEVTQELYQAVIGVNPSDLKNRPKNPVECVSWFDAILFCNKLSELQGLEECYILTDISTIDEYGVDQKRIMSAKVTCDFSKNGYRLPKEKEWEYAAKAGTKNQYAGTDKDPDLVHYAVYAENSKIKGERQPHSVKTKKPNKWGFYDMSGNVWEWCWDKYDPKNPDTSAFRVRRGGSWRSDASDLRSAARLISTPDYRRVVDGFRVCRTLV